MPGEQWRANWKERRELGAGGQGTTYEVVSLSDSTRRGVLKILNKGSDEQARARMAHEAINLAILAKQGLKVPAHLEDNTQHYLDAAVELYLVMEFVEGETLDRVVKTSGGRLDLDHSVAIAQDLCATVAAMHARHVLHRDLKPANLMVRDFEKADVVVLDFGLSFNREPKQESQTRTGETIKNELLALPEATGRGGDRRDARSDITNIVAVFFYCLTGQLLGLLRDEKNLAPHHRTGLTMREILAGDARWEQVEFLFDLGFAVDIDGRFQTIEELQERLAFVLRPTGLKKDPVQVAREVGAKIRRRDRKVHVLQYVPVAEAIQRQIVVLTQTFREKVQPFSVSLANVGPNLPLPTGLDLVFDIGVAIVVGLQTRSHTRITKLIVCAKGDRCVLLRASWLNQPGASRTSPTAWKEVAWFDPTKPLDQEKVADWVNEIVVTAMQEFETEPLAVDK